MSLNKKFFHKSSTCFFDLTTCQRQNFSIPEKIVYYIAKNCKNGKTFQKLVQTCKYIFKVNPVVVVSRLICLYDKWYACYDEDGGHRVEFKYDRAINYKIWVTRKFLCFSADASKMIPLIYKNDAKVVNIQNGPLKFEEFLFLAGNAEELTLMNRLVKYENGETVQLEDIVKSVPELKTFDFRQCFDGNDVNCNTVRKLMEIEHFKNVSKLEFYNVSEALDFEGMFKYITENKHIEVDLFYRHYISDACKELIQEYSNQLQNEKGCYSVIGFIGMNYNNVDELLNSSSEGESSDTSFESFDDDNVSSDVDKNDDLLFPWNTEEDEEWELPWDKE